MAKTAINKLHFWGAQEFPMTAEEIVRATPILGTGEHPTEQARPMGWLTWCHQLFPWRHSSRMHRQPTASLWSDHCWDAAREQVRRPPTESARELHASQSGASHRFLLYTFVP
jgi:hypothetical protein